MKSELEKKDYKQKVLKPLKISGDSSGITMVETIVALYVLIIAITSIVSVVVHSHATYRGNVQKITALALATEGVEVVRNIRDGNWLPPNGIDYCDSTLGNQYCYEEWQDLPNGHILASYCQNGCQAVFNESSNRWSLSNSSSDYALYKQNDSTYTTNPSGNPVYFRKITVTAYDPDDNNDPPREVGVGEPHPELGVKSVVSWIGSNCNDFGSDPENANSNCKVTTETRLTNWKNY